MTETVPWMMLVLVGMVMTLRSLRTCESDAMMSDLLEDENLVPVARGPKFGSGESQGARAWAWSVGAVLFSVGILVSKQALTPHALLFALCGAGAGELYYRSKRERVAKLTAKRLEFFLPLAMERVVMAVSSGLDIIPALREAAGENSDPVSEVFRKIVGLSESGLRVENAISSVANSVSSHSVKHALVHLGLAYTQGGEVIRPLKELSDATQAQYQETIEEEIARLPVKGVVPLIVTFTGLIVCFLTVPVVQITTSLEKIANVER